MLMDPPERASLGDAGNHKFNETELNRQNPMSTI